VYEPREFAQRHGADPGDLAAVLAYASSCGLSVVQEHAARRTVVLQGTVAQFNAAFQVSCQQMRHDSCSYRGRTGCITLRVCSMAGEAVLVLIAGRRASPHFRMRPGGERATFAPVLYAATHRGNETAAGVGALIELAAGFRPRGFDAYFKGLGVASPT